MEQFSNRVEHELLQFKSREERLGKLFPSENVKDSFVLAEKVKFYSYLLLKFKESRNPDEIYLLNKIQIQKRQSEKELYPNKFVQMMRKAFIFFSAEKRYAAALKNDVIIGHKKLLDEISRLGLQISSDKILPNLESGKDRFSVSVSNYVNEKERVEQQLVFLKDISGVYSFEGFKAALHKEGSPESCREHFFKNEQRAFSPEQAFHLLAGRALEKDGSWLQFDLTDKNAEGCYRIKEFRADYGFNLKNDLEALPLKDKSAEHIDTLLQALKRGEARTAVFEVKDKVHGFSIQANPQFKTVDIYDEHLKKINLSALREKRVAKTSQKINAGKSAKQKSKKAVRIQ